MAIGTRAVEPSHCGEVVAQPVYAHSNTSHMVHEVVGTDLQHEGPAHAS